MSVILFYSPFFRRSRDVESLMLAFKAQGHRVLSLNQVDGTEFNTFLTENGIEATSFVVPGKKDLRYYIRHLHYFIGFCRGNHVTAVFSHLDGPNFVAAIGQYFIRAKVYLCRHHIDQASLYNYHRSWTYRLTNRLSRKTIVVSERAREYMIKEEHVAPGKLIHINLAYDFSLFKMPSQGDIQRIRNSMGTEVLLVTACRLTKFKRPDVSVKVVEALNRDGINAGLILLGEGEMEHELREYIVANNLSKKVLLPGHVGNALDYLAASDFVIHPSASESSCVVVKEAGLVKKPVIVCRSVGDFDDYLKDGLNGFLVDRESFVEDAVRAMLAHLKDKGKLEVIGENLSRDIRRLFGVDYVLKEYNRLVE